MSDPSNRRSFFGARPHRNLFISFLIIIVAAVVLPEESIGGQIYDFMVAGLFLIALVETASSRRNLFIALAIGLPAIIVRLFFSYAEDDRTVNSAVLLLSGLFFCFLIWNFLRDLLTSDRPTSERVFAALTAYLCIGLLFALIYAHFYFRDPASFKIPDQLVTTATDSESRTVPAFTYFSFVTLTTLGYGDFVPLSEEARTVAWLEAVIGQLYLAVMVGGLVGVFFAEASRQATQATFGPGREDVSSDGNDPDRPVV